MKKHFNNDNYRNNGNYSVQDGAFTAQLRIIIEIQEWVSYNLECINK